MPPVGKKPIKKAAPVATGRGTTPVQEQTLAEKVEMWYGVATNPETEPDVLKQVVCSFFRCGGMSDCRGCEQDPFTVQECANYFSFQ